ncbi:5256_t:CDS:2, partial [Gigaspora rosea]
SYEDLEVKHATLEAKHVDLQVTKHVDLKVKYAALKTKHMELEENIRLPKIII